MIIDEEDYLAHFGVKGMKWGVRREERAVGRQSKREQKAQKFLAKADQIQDQIESVKKTKVTRSGKLTAGGRRQINKLEQDKTQALKDAEAKRQGKLTDHQRKVAIGAAAVGGIVAATVTVKLVQKGEFRRLGAKGKAALGHDISFKQNSALAEAGLSPEQIHQRVVKGVNPDYGGIGTKMNCRRCTFAYEMRRRGMDVQATRTTSGSGQNASGLLNAVTPGEKLLPTGKIPTLFNAAKQAGKKADNPDAVTPLLDLVKTGPGKSAIPGTHPLVILETLAREPNGSRGELGVTWRGGGGHSLAYEIINGAPVIFDTQNGRMYKEDRFLGALPGISSAAFTRLDNLPLNNDQLLRWVRNAD
jgi:hypothetical protein